MTAADTVSLVIPVHNGTRFLSETLDSVVAQEHPVEIVVVDDGSTDGSGDIARARGTRCIRLEGEGVAAARNAGAAVASGEFLSFLDQDDLWPPGALRRLLEVMRTRPDVDVVIGIVEVFVEPGTETPAWLPAELLDGPRRAIQTGACLIRRRGWGAVGPFDPRHAPADDADWIMRAKDAVVIAEIDDVVLRHRLHGANQSYRVDVVRQALLSAVRASVDRKGDRA